MAEEYALRQQRRKALLSTATLVKIGLLLATSLILSQAECIQGLDGLRDIDVGAICGQGIYSCAGCPSGGGNATANPQGKPLSDFHGAYVQQLVTTVRSQGWSIVPEPRLRATAYLTKLAIYTVPGDIVETGVFTGTEAVPRGHK